MQQHLPCAKKLKTILDEMHVFSFLLAARATLLLALTAHDFAQHHDTIAVNESNARETLAVLESVAHQWLLRLEGAFRHLVRLQGVRLLHFLSTCFFPHLPHELRNAACRPTATHETDR